LRIAVGAQVTEVVWAIVLPAAINMIKDQPQGPVIPDERLRVEHAFRVIATLGHVVLLAIKPVATPDR
jgi:hypothetical protein